MSAVHGARAIGLCFCRWVRIAASTRPRRTAGASDRGLKRTYLELEGDLEGD